MDELENNYELKFSSNQDGAIDMWGNSRFVNYTSEDVMKKLRRISTMPLHFPYKRWLKKFVQRNEKLTLYFDQ